MPEVEQLAGHHFIQAVHAGNSVSQRENGTHFVHGHLGLIVLNLFTDKFCNFVCFDLSHVYFFRSSALCSNNLVLDFL
jgi:hypothetical protein